MRHHTPVILMAVVGLSLGVAFADHRGEKTNNAMAKDSLPTATDMSLDGGDWHMGSFKFGEGVKAGAETENFDDKAFSQVSVPGDTQLQAGFTGPASYEESNDLMRVNAREWWYRKHFRATRPRPGMVTKLIFDGADYFATVWLNGELLGTHEGTYVGFSFDVSKRLHFGADNVLSVLITHPWNPKGRSFLEYLNGTFSLAFPGWDMSLKNMPYFMGSEWDELPAFGNAAFDMGIWRSVHLRTESQLSLSDLHVYTKTIDADGSALLHVSATVENDATEAHDATISLTLKPDNFDGEAQELPEQKVNVASHENATVEEDVRVKNAQLWWSWDRGPQHLYMLKAEIGARDRLPGSARTVTFGIRTIRRDAGMAYWLNGKRLFIRGSWFPIENYYRSTPTQEDYERDLRLYRDTNFNMVVNYSVIEKPEFYDLCDRLGLLVVTQLPFSQMGGYQLLDRDNVRRTAFLEQARIQVSEMITELRNHPSMIEWAPLAEAHSKEDGKWNGGQVDQEGYDEFVSEIRNIVNQLAPDAVFHPSLCDLGEEHFWWAGQWWENELYQKQFDSAADFISEYGTLSTDNIDTMRTYMSPKEIWDKGFDPDLRWFDLPIDPRAWSYWTDVLNTGLYSILYRTHNFVDKNPQSAAELARDTQIYQAFLIKYSAEAYRRKKYDPVAGIRQWAFKDVAPGTRCTILDYNSEPKVSYWYMKRAQSLVQISFAYKDALESQLAGRQWSVPVWLVNDMRREIRGTIHTELLALNGKSVASSDFAVYVPADGKEKVGIFSLVLPKESGVYMLRATLQSTGEQIEGAKDTAFIKVVPPEFAAPHRVLLIAQRKWADPIAKILGSLGLSVDIYDENSLEAVERNLYDGATIHAKYDVIWLGTFTNFAKFVPEATTSALRDAVKAGTGFIHTGGVGSFHGGEGHAALLGATDLAAGLPVELSPYYDLQVGPHPPDDLDLTLGLDAPDELKSDRHWIRQIDAAITKNGYAPESLTLLQHYGLPAFNDVTALPSAAVQLTIAHHPLLVTGKYDSGKTVVFTGFTPTADEFTSLPIDEYLLKEPPLRAYFSLFADLLADAMPGIDLGRRGILAQHQKPLYEMLKEQPETKLEVAEAQVPVLKGVEGRWRVTVTNVGGYAHLVNLHVNWNGNGEKPFLTEESDNDFELLPKESKQIDVTWRSSAVDHHVAGTLTVTAANAPETHINF